MSLVIKFSVTRIGSWKHVASVESWGDLYGANQLLAWISPMVDKASGSMSRELLQTNLSKEQAGTWIRLSVILVLTFLLPSFKPGAHSSFCRKGKMVHPFPGTDSSQCGAVPKPPILPFLSSSFPHERICLVSQRVLSYKLLHMHFSCT